MPQTGLRLDWNAREATSADDWDGLLARAGKSSLEQSWVYGAAMEVLSRRRVRRGVLADDVGVLAAVQAYERPVAGLGVPYGLAAQRNPARRAVLRHYPIFRGIDRLSAFQVIHQPAFIRRPIIEMNNPGPRQECGGEIVGAVIQMGFEIARYVKYPRLHAPRPSGESRNIERQFDRLVGSPRASRSSRQSHALIARAPM
jgi:hypothetical protein